jgi:tetratricopeptide (TPR) repeat protein
MALLQTPKPVNLPQTIQRAFELQRQGKLPQAEQLYAQVLAVRPDYFDALHMLGVIKLEQGNPTGALQLMLGALKARPKSPEVLLNYSLVLNVLGRHDDALAALDLLLAVKRRSVEAHNNRGAILEKLDRAEEALECFECALEIKSNHVDALYNKACVLRRLGRHDEALKSFDRVLILKPDHAKAHNNRGTALEALARRDEAIASYDRALALKPDFVEALNNRANALLKQGRPQDALECYERALAIDPFHVEVLNNRGNALAALGRHSEALASCRRAYGVNPNYVNAQWHASLLKLRLGDYAGGFRQYEWRWQREENAKHRHNFAQPLWLGDAPVAGKTILLHHEQGFGDTIQMARYAPLLTAQGAHVILGVQPPLKSLMAGIGHGVQVVGSGEPIPDFDLHCPLMSLPLAFRTELTTVPANIPYLVLPPGALDRWQAHLPERRGFRVGLVWSGNVTHRDDHNRSIAFVGLAPLLEVPGLQFFSLQKELREADAAALAAEPRVTDIARAFDDFTDTAAAVALMDLVISVDTSVAHLAGALGKPVWLLLPLCPDWRWLTEREDSPWYPTARLFRQPAIGDWASVIMQVRQQLSARAEAEKQNG